MKEFLSIVFFVAGGAVIGYGLGLTAVRNTEEQPRVIDVKQLKIEEYELIEGRSCAVLTDGKTILGFDCVR